MHEVIYFKGAGRAEVTRIMLHSAGVEFKDTRFGFDEWSKIKPRTPLGQLPLLKIDGKTYTQSLAMQRYAAKKAGFYPQDDLDALLCDEACDVMEEMTSKFPFFAATEDEKKSKREEYQSGPMTTITKFLEEKIQSAGGKGFVASGQPCVADVMMMASVKQIESGMMDYINKDFYKDYPGITACSNAMKENPKIKAYYDSLN